MSNADRDSYLRDAPPARSRARDLVIVASMVLVAVAFGAALLVNGGFGLGPSIIGGLGLLVLTMFLHTMMRRLQAMSSAGNATSQEAIALDVATAPPSAASASPAEGVEDDGEHGWGEPADVKNLVRHLATELQRTPGAPIPPGAAPASHETRIETARPMPAPARPLASERALSPAEPAPSRPMPSRTPAPPIAAAREDILDIVRHAIETEDIEIHLQPVMSLADRRTHLYEAFPRIRDGRGSLVRPEAYARAASETGLASGIERVAFRRMVQILGRLIERGKQRPVFCPLSAEALRDGTFLRAFHETLRAGPAFAANLVFEMPESELGRLGLSERDAIHALANAGFRFSIQDVVQLDMDSIGDLPIAFVKLLPIAISGQPGHAAGLVARIRSIGAEPVVDGVQDERDISVAQALGIVLGQGGFLSEPRPLKAGVAGDTRTGT